PGKPGSFLFNPKALDVPKRYPQSTGLLLGFAAYLIWGSFPLIINQTKFANPIEVVTWRVVFGFVFAALLITIMRRWKTIFGLLRNPRKLKWLLLAAVFIFINWEVYVVAVATNNTIESSLGYFINPLITILFAVLFLKEKLRRGQWIALGIGLVAVLVLTIDYGRPPFIALTLALSFAIYSLAKNKVGGKINAVESFTLESLLVLPIAIGQLLFMATLEPVMLTSSPLHASVLIGFGIMTAVPLILFGAAASRVPLSTIGFIQYLTPVLQFLTAFFILGEPMPAVRWIGFSLVWFSLVILTFDALRARRKALQIQPIS
ncbi:MAG: EamA family transporter RarD, partial [Actinomycetota bacterium]